MSAAPFRLDGKVAFVTGASRGIGQTVAIALAHAGADVALLTRSASPDTTHAIQDAGKRTTTVYRDLATATPGQLHSAVSEVIDAFGRLDILVNNAGTIRRAPAVEYTADDWDTVLTTNLTAVFHLTQAAAADMIPRQYGRIINVASMLSYQGGIHVPAYTASKHGIVGLTQAFANEWAPTGITVNAIAPGYIATDNTKPLRADPSRAHEILSRIPTGRWGTPDDLVGAFLYLASDAAAYTTGITIPVDGGWLAR